MQSRSIGPRFSTSVGVAAEVGVLADSVAFYAASSVAVLGWVAFRRVAETRLGEERWRRLARGLERGVLTLFVGSLVLLSLLQVLLRNLLHYGLPWIDPLTRHMVLWIAFLGAIAAAGHLKHIHMDVAGRLLPVGPRLLLRRTTALAAAAVSLVLSRAAWLYLSDERRFGGEAFLGIPSWVATGIVWLGFLGLAARFLSRALASGESLGRVLEEIDGGAGGATLETRKQKILEVVILLVWAATAAGALGLTGGVGWILAGVVMALLGTPLFAVLGFFALRAFAAEDISVAAVATEMVRLASSPVLVSIPLFTLAGYLFAASRMPRRLLALTSAFLGWMPGGVAVVAMVACAVFTAFTGASGVTIIALGGLLMPVLLAEGFRERFALGLLTTGGSLGILFPPSLALILYSYVASNTAGSLGLGLSRGPSVDRLFLAGLLPGLLLIGLLSILAVRARPRGSDGSRATSGVGKWEALRRAAWELPLPLIVLGGIYGGRLTVTEAAAATAAYGLLAEVLLYKDISLRRVPEVASESVTLVGGILIILASALGLTNYLIDAEVPAAVLGWIQGVVTSRFAFLLALNVFLLIVGCLMDIFSALIVVVPLIVPLALQYGVDLVHLGIIFLANLEIGYSTPPVGLNLFISSFRFGKPVVEVYVASFPFLLMELVALGLITYLPDLSLFLVRLFG